MSGEQLERRYRRLLRILPKSYREARGEELISTLMDASAEDGRTRPELREVVSLVGLGLRARLGRAAEGGDLATTRTGEMVRTVAITGTPLLTFIGLTQLAMLFANVHSDPVAGWSWSDPFEFAIGDHRLDMLPTEVPACWLAVLGLITVGWWRTARLLGLGVFLISAYLSDEMELALREETVLAGVVTAALFAVRGAHARRALVPGLAATAALLTVAGVVYRAQEHLPPGKASRIPVRMLDVLQGHGATGNRHAMVLAALGLLAVGVLGYRSSVWPVGLAVVAVAAVGPDLILVSQRPYYVDGDQIPLAFLAGGLVLVAALAVLKERLAGRSGRSTAPGALAG